MMKKQEPVCCPYCTCDDVGKVKDKGLIEIGPLEFDQDEDSPMDIWMCSECNRRFIILDDS